MVADVQALTDNYNNPEKVRQNVLYEEDVNINDRIVGNRFY